MGIFTHVAGSQNGRFFRIVPAFVDTSKPAGFSPLPVPTFHDWLANALALQHIWGSGNLIWTAIALAMYFLFPYDLAPATSIAAQGPLTWAFFQERFPLWFATTFAYVGFWYITLYVLGWAERPFIPNRPRNWDKLAHDVFYNVVAVAIWVGFENVFAFLWATGRLPYMSDAEALGSMRGALRFVGGLVLVPMWRDVHFYFAHRLLHYKPVYQQVHSLHHRNTDVEPFSGLAMHPVEHLYYYACILPSLLLFASPFHFLWNGVHLLLSPAAGHSGWQDHAGGSAWHYMHHRYFEVNYSGFSAAFLDQVFGSFQACFRERQGEPVKPRGDAKATLRGLPTSEFLLYLTLSALCVGAWAYAATQTPAAGGSLVLGKNAALGLAVLAGAGPVLVAYLFALVLNGPASFMEPFQKRPVAENLLHLLVGNAFSALPVVLACYWALL